MSEREQELAPCPFCTDITAKVVNTIGARLVVECQTCFACAAADTSELRAVANWNRRPQEGNP